MSGSKLLLWSVLVLFVGLTIFVVAEVNVKFHAPARLNEDLVVTAGLVENTRVSFDIDQKIYRHSTDGDLLISGIVKAAFLDADSMRPKRLPPSLIEEMTK